MTKDPMPPLPAEPRKWSRWTHVKTGHDYMVLTLAWREEDRTPVVVYQRYELKKGFLDAEVWVRPLPEFLDGRFQPRE